MTRPNALPAAFPADARIRAWFSFRSPYSYLGIHKALKSSLPLDLVATWPDGEVGSTSSPRKMAYLIEDCLRLFEEEGLPFAPPVDVADWARPHAAFHMAQKAGKGTDFVLAAYRARWSESKDLAATTVIGGLAEEVGIEPQSAINAMDDPALREELLAIRTQFEQDEIVGVPFFVYEGQRFWGQDRVDALVRHINKVHSDG